MINNLLVWIDQNPDKIDVVYFVAIVMFCTFATLICAVVF